MGPAPSVAAVRSAVRGALTDAHRTGAVPVLVACSGGADSLALAAAVAFEAPRHGVRAGLLTVDHGLQPGSVGRAARVAALGYELGLDPVLTLPVLVGSNGGMEAAARTARYAALDAAADALGADVVLGHTRDDQAETVLLGLGRGSGPRSIVGMAPRDGRYLRPLLGLRRSSTVAACAALGLPVWDDPHNSDPARQRARLRVEALPLLERVLQGGVVEALARTADLLRDDLDALDAQAANALSTALVDRPSGPELELAALLAQPRAVRSRMLRAWATRLGAESLSAERTGALEALVTAWHGQGPVQLPGGVAVRRASGRLTRCPPAPSSSLSTVPE